MLAKTKFLKLCDKLPKEARKTLGFFLDSEPYTINVMAMEVKANTKLGKTILFALGFEDDK